MPREDFIPPWLDVDYFKRLREARERAMRQEYERRWREMMADVYGHEEPSEVTRAVEHRPHSDLDPRQYGPQDIDALLESL